jgi:uncharacterized protein Smg (DUF494 family)
VDSRILEIVFCLMDFVQDGDEPMINLPEYSSNLKNLGYTDEEISTAYHWILNHMGSPSESLYSAFPTCTLSTRVLSEVERARLAPEAYGFLLKLANTGMINGEQFETILDRLALSGSRVMTPDQIKLIASAVMFNEYGEAERDLVGDFSVESSTQIN